MYIDVSGTPSFMVPSLAPNMTSAPEMSASQPSKPTIIGIYGISGCGKSYRLEQLKQDATLQAQRFVFYDGSELIDKVTPGGLEAYKAMEKDQKDGYIEAALDRLSAECQANKKTAVVTGHCMLWNPKKEPKHLNVSTEKDWETYTHMIYLNVSPEVVAQRIEDDRTRTRMVTTVPELTDWQTKERIELGKMCWQRRVLFTTISEELGTPAGQTLEKLKRMLRDFAQHNEDVNDDAVYETLDREIESHGSREKVLLLDADKTLSPCDTGKIFWQAPGLKMDSTDDPLKALFTSQGYSYASFRQATLLHEEHADEFDDVCEDVAADVELYPEMKELLVRVAATPHIGAIVVTCGLRSIWEKVLARHGLSHVKVIGGGRIEDGYVVTGAVKGKIVDELHAKNLRVLAYGDSTLDMEMLKKADEAYVVVGGEATRSTSMDSALEDAAKEGFGFAQIILCEGAGPRMDRNRLPEVTLDTSEMDRIVKPREPSLTVANTRTAKLLATATRDAALRGHQLRTAHEEIGYYLAVEYLSDIVGVEEIDITHVQGQRTDGYRFRHESSTMIIPMMRGGEPMAFGVSRAFQTASFVHAKKYEDIEKNRFIGKRTVILVDSVINKGKSVFDFMGELRKEHPALRVIVLTGVVQTNAVKVGGLAEMLAKDDNLSIVALRKSENSYTGRKGTDTGHRMFNTTNLE
jgi:uracil phosphoribosyltransferase/phosphoserine phosphatase/adenylate kinase